MRSKKQPLLPKFQKILEQMGENIRLARKRRNLTTVQVAKAKEQKKSVPILYDIDFLLGVHDLSRMGGLTI